MPAENNIKFGLKLWSVNTDLAATAGDLYRRGMYDYLELYAVPETFEKTITEWEKHKIPCMIHCPHSGHGFNLARKELEEHNKSVFTEVRLFSDTLGAEIIIIHGGNNGPIDEVIRQLKGIYDQRIYLENKPRLGINGEICIGWTPDKLQKIRDEADLGGIVLDFGHAICAANSSEEDIWEYIQGFLALEPRIFHIGDGDKFSEKDNHFHFGEGSFDIARLISLVPAGSFVTIETPMNPENNLQDFAQNLSYLKNFVTASS